MLSQLFILFKFITPSIFISLLFINSGFASFSALHVTKICSVSLVTDARNNIPIGVNL